MDEVTGAKTGYGRSGTTLRPGVVASRRSALTILAKLASDPIRSIPPEAFEARMVVSNVFGATRVYLSEPSLIQDALVRGADHLFKSDEMKRVLSPALGDGLLTADGASWRWQRQTMAPAFQHARLTALLPLMIKAAESTRDRWLPMPAGATVDIGHEMMMTTFAIIIDTMLSGSARLDAAGVERAVSDYLSATPWMFVFALLKAPAWLPYPGSRKAARANRVLRGTLQARVAARRGAPSNHADDLLGMLLAATDPQTGRAMSDEEITDNILTFIAAGHETTALALAWTFGLLAKHPECLARLVAEVDAVTGDGPVRPGHIGALTYTRQVIDETMRLYPPAPLIARRVEKPFEIEGVALPVGSVLFVPIYALHRHVSLWDRPGVFDPDRFAPETAGTRHRYAYMPFGAGPRVCIGTAFATMEAVAILAVIVKALRLELVGAALPKARMVVTLRPWTPMMMRVGRR